MTAQDLRAKFGAPLSQDIFTISPGFELTVEYGPDGQVCLLKLPGTAPDENGAFTAERVDEALLELVPMSMRGKEIGSGLRAIGGRYMKNTICEHVLICEHQDPRDPGSRSHVSVGFAIHHQSSSTS
jgi:hypothetical protein